MIVHDAMPTTERTPLLAEDRGHGRAGPSSDATTSSSRRQDKIPRARIPLANPSTINAPPNIRKITSALRAGKLPDNNQLYTLLTSAAAFLETISDAAAPPHGNVEASAASRDDLFKSASAAASSSSTSGGIGGTREYQPHGDDPSLLVAAILAESSAFARLLGRWLHGTDGSAKRGKSGESREEQHQRGAYTAPYGNANEQIQRFIWHAGQALSSGDQGGVVDVEASGGLEGGAQEALDAVKRAAAEVQQDAASGIKAIARVVAGVLSSDELMRIPSDIIRHLSGQAADVLEEVRKRSANAEHILREESAPEKPQDDFVPPKQAIQEGVNAFAEATDAAITRSQKSKESQAHDSAQTWEDETAKRLARLMDELGQDETFTRAIDQATKLCHKYLRAIDKAKADVGVSVEEAKDLADDAVHPTLEAKSSGGGAHDAEDPMGATATISSDVMEAQVSAHFSHHALAAFQAMREIIEGLAGGRDLGAVLDRAIELRKLALENSSTRQWVEDVLAFVQSSITDVEGAIKGDGVPSKATRDKRAEQIKDFIVRLQQITKEQPRLQEKWEALRGDSNDVVLAVQTNTTMSKLSAHLRHIKKMTRDLFVVGTREVREKTTNVLSRLFNAILPRIGDILGYIPLPRVEFASENLDATIEDVNIAALQLIPETMRFTTTNDWQWDRRQDVVGIAPWHTNSSARISFGGLRLALKDISFFVQERFTAPSEEACCACCSFGHSTSTWCICRGPSSWLAYTERAIMDVGFGNEGVSVDIDVEDSGQSAKAWRQERKKQREKRKKQRENKASGNVDVDAARRKYADSDEELDLDFSDTSDEDEDSWHEREDKRNRRTTFFNVKECRVHVSNSFDFQLRNSRHWLLNSIVRYSTRPIIRLILRRIMAAQISRAFSLADAFAWDLHTRARHVHERRRRNNDVIHEPKLKQDPLRAFPSLADYFRVLVDDTAGKSRRRLEYEKRQKEKHEKERREKAARDSDGNTTQQPSGKKSMEVKASGIAMHDEDGDYSIAIGFTSQPGTILRDERQEQHGPPTTRTKVRDAATNPRETLATVQGYGSAIHKAGLDAARNTAEEVKQTAADTVSQRTSKAPSATERDRERPERSGSDLEGDESDANVDIDEGWRSSAFAL